MNIAKIKISNVLGIEDLAFDAGKITYIEGGNAQGKTSILEAIKAAVRGGHDATLLRNGSSQGQVVLVFDDGLEVKKKISSETSATDISINGRPWQKSPMTYLNSLSDAAAVNPVEFLLASEKQRTQMLLEALPITISDDELFAAGAIKTKVNEHNPLATLDIVRTRIYDTRHDTSKRAREKEATAMQLLEALPIAVHDATTDTNDLRAQYKSVSDLYNDALAKRNSDTAELRAEIHATYEQRLLAIQSERDTAMHALDSEHNEAVAVLSNTYQPQLAELTDQITIAIEADKQRASADKQRAIVAEMQEQAKVLREDSEVLTGRLEAIDNLKAAKLASLPIAGLTYVDGQFLLDGVTIDRLNSAKQIQLAVDIALLRSKELKLICVDGIELLDESNRKAFIAHCEQSEAQFFVTRVTNGELNITQHTQE